MSEKELSDLISQIGDALSDAIDHLEYCGYGDKWERECADYQGLSEKLTNAHEAYKKFNEICKTIYR